MTVPLEIPREDRWAIVYEGSGDWAVWFDGHEVATIRGDWSHLSGKRQHIAEWQDNMVDWIRSALNRQDKWEPAPAKPVDQPENSEIADEENPNEHGETGSWTFSQ